MADSGSGNILCGCGGPEKKKKRDYFISVVEVILGEGDDSDAALELMFCGCTHLRFGLFIAECGLFGTDSYKAGLAVPKASVERATKLGRKKKVVRKTFS